MCVVLRVVEITQTRKSYSFCSRHAVHIIRENLASRHVTILRNRQIFVRTFLQSGMLVYCDCDKLIMLDEIVIVRVKQSSPLK